VRHIATSLLLLCGACAKGPESSSIETVQCVPRGLGAEGLDAQWQPFAAHIQACVVIDPAGMPALEIIAVSVTSLAEMKPHRSEALALPKPLILLPGGRIAGRLPYNYPQAPPAATTLRFSDWHEGVPARIDVQVSGPATSETHATRRLQWDAQRGEYDNHDVGD
jgi:hypothetical protein